MYNYISLYIYTLKIILIIIVITVIIVKKI